MPTYEYRCLDCGHEFEQFQMMSDDPLKVCPECNGNVKRLIGTGAGIIFKGSGFYQTDYRSEGYKKAAQKDKSASTTSSSSSDSKKDSKSTSKSESSKKAS